MTEDKATTLLPPAHRYKGRPYAWLVTSLVGHTTAHATQIRQFITTPPARPTPWANDGEADVDGHSLLPVSPARR